MTIIKRKSKKKNFSIIDNGGILDRSLSWKATGLWTWLMSKPEDWEVNLENLCSSKSDGKDSVLSALSELEESGYLIYQRWRNSTGQFESAYTVFESPEQLNDWKQGASQEELSCIGKVSKTKGRKKPISEKPYRKNHSGKPAVEKPQWESHNGLTTVENPQQLNIELINTDLPITEVVVPAKESEKKKQNAVRPQDDVVVDKSFSSLTNQQDLPQASNTIHETEDSAACDNNADLDIVAKKEIESVRMNWRSRPWRLSATSFKPEMLNAVFQSNPKPHESGGFGLMTDSGATIPNENFIVRFLNSLEKKLNAFDVMAFDELKRYWRMAELISEAAKPRERPPVPNPTANASTITPEQARIAKEIINKARANARY